MQIEIKKLSGTEIEISGELPSADFDNFWTEAVEKVSARTDLDGFRPGKIPENILIQKVGESEILEEAAQLALESLWPKILTEKNMEPLGHPEIVITKLARGNPLGFKIKTVVLPEVKLPDYRGIATGILSRTDSEITVGEKEIADALEYLRKARAKDAAAGGEQIAPELNDDFAKSLGNFKNLEALKDNLRENIKIEKTIKQSEKKRMEVLDTVSREAGMEVPPVLIDFEKQKMISELKENLTGIGLTWEHYLDHIKKTEEDLKSEWGTEAEKRVRYGLTLREIAKAEKIQVDNDELEREVTLLMSRVPPEEASNLDPQKLKDYAYGIIRNEKVFKILEGPKK